MARNMHRYEELTPYEFELEKERASIIYISAGPLEYHEECNILGMDTNKGYDWCLAAAEITGGIVFPMLPVAPAGHRPFRTREELKARFSLPRHRDTYEESFGSMYPSVFISRETCRALYEELLETFALELGFKMCVFIGSHGPVGEMLRQIIEEETEAKTDRVGTFRGMRLLIADSRDYNRDIIKAFYAEQGIASTYHGGVWETALNYAINPDYFHPELLDETRYPQHFGPLPEAYSPGRKRPSKSEFRKFTPEFAKEMRDTTIRRLAEDVLKNYKELV